MKTTNQFKAFRIFSGALITATLLGLGSSVAMAEDDMMGSMPKDQPAAQAQPMNSDSADTMAKDHEQMKKDHKKMMKSNSMAQSAEKKKMGKMKKKNMDMMKMDSMEGDKAKDPAEPMPADGMGHM